jgi:RNA recognition motif-containing protein
MREGELLALFSTIAPVHSCRVMVHPRTGESKGFGFVSYNNIADAHKAVQALNRHSVAGKYMFVNFKKSNAR